MFDLAGKHMTGGSRCKPTDEGVGEVNCDKSESGDTHNQL